MSTPPNQRARFRGCLLGGAVGDALGAAVEFDSLAAIRRRFGPAGIRDFAPAYGRVGAITDDTQMTLFSAEGMLRAFVRWSDRGICGVEGVIHHAYLRWLLTQSERPANADATIGTDGWLFAQSELHARRAPGNTCLAALGQATHIGRPSRAKNDSKGCGGVMRSAPFGLFPADQDDAGIFDLAADAAALTHGHPSGYLSAGFLALAVTALVKGNSLDAAFDIATAELRRRTQHQETMAAVEAARALAKRGRPTPEQIETLGQGWVAEEALGIAICCAATARDFADGVILAVNHSGDSDSTGSLTGNLLGALFGDSVIPVRWLQQLELREVITQVADDLHDAANRTLDLNAAAQRYPGW